MSETVPMELLAERASLMVATCHENNMFPVLVCCVTMDKRLAITGFCDYDAESLIEMLQDFLASAKACKPEDLHHLYFLKD
jgi:hypothetical protein